MSTFGHNVFFEFFFPQPFLTLRGGGPPKRCYYFGTNGQAEGDASMKTILGGKGANCAEMAKVGLSVPPGFTITCQVEDTFSFLLCPVLPLTSS